MSFNVYRKGGVTRLSNGVIGFREFCSIGTPYHNVVNIYDGRMDFMRCGKTKSEAFHILIGKCMSGKETGMNRKLIIDGNAVYEIDETCMLKKQLEEKKEKEQAEMRNQETEGYQMRESIP